MGGINPMAFASILAAQDPTKWGPMLDGLAAQGMLPQDPNQFFQQVGMPGPGQQPEIDLGAALAPQPPPDPMTQPMPLPPEANAGPSIAPIAPSMAPGPVPPIAPGMVPPSMTATPPGQQRNPITPQVKAPDASAARPIMSGGVAGAQKAPDFGGKATLPTPAQMMMSALLNAPGGGAPVPHLGALLRGGKY